MAAPGNKLEKTHTVVELMKGSKKWVATIPRKWLYEEQGQLFCWWPNHMLISQAARAAEKNVDASDTWDSYLAVVLYKGGSHAKCILKEGLIMKGKESSLETDSDCNKSRSKHGGSSTSKQGAGSSGKRKRQHGDHSGGEDIFDLESEIEGLQGVPVSTNASTSSQGKWNDSSADRNSINSGGDSASRNSSNSGVNRNIAKGPLQPRQDFQEMVIMRLDHITEMLKESIQREKRFRHRTAIQLSDLHKAVGGQRLVVPAAALEEVQLPVQTAADLQKLEQLIKGSDTKYTTLVNFLGCHGTPAASKDNISRVLSSLFTDEVMKNYNWEGQSSLSNKDGLGVLYPTVVKALMDGLLAGCKGKWDDKFLRTCAMRYVVKAKQRIATALSSARKAEERRLEAERRRLENAST